MILPYKNTTFNNHDQYVYFILSAHPVLILQAVEGHVSEWIFWAMQVHLLQSFKAGERNVQRVELLVKQLETRHMQQRVEMGDRSLGIADGMLSKERAVSAFEATVQVRNKVREA